MKIIKCADCGIDVECGGTRQEMCVACAKARKAIQDRRYREANKRKLKESKAKYFQENKADIMKQHRAYYEKNKSAVRKAQQDYNRANDAAIKEWHKKNYQKIKPERRVYLKERYDSDPVYKLGCNLRTSVYMAIKSNSRSGRSVELLGCSVKFLKKHIESKFTDGMTWDNWGFDGWHIDHIRPKASFDMSNPEDQKACFHYSNLQPLWAVDNLSKGDNWDGDMFVPLELMI